MMMRDRETRGDRQAVRGQRQKQRVSPPDAMIAESTPGPGRAPECDQILTAIRKSGLHRVS